MAQSGARSFLSSGAGDTGIRDAPVQSLSPQPSQADTAWPSRHSCHRVLTPCAWSLCSGSVLASLGGFPNNASALKNTWLHSYKRIWNKNHEWGWCMSPVAGCGPHTLGRSCRLVKPTEGGFEDVGCGSRPTCWSKQALRPGLSPDTWPFPAVGPGPLVHFTSEPQFLLVQSREVGWIMGPGSWPSSVGAF